ncbi:MAG: 16S rRNA (adenine(1518)-N(6)/adenine(1519)-N(6))-dimethyltransferase RsmA [Muribaculaceae bacterium]|nr:16S rRNA (adenine(1518)-N(6)/adenine(1519)-N(6))-dimethyltransferase RsmA [Muribaculaceae bacterium]
MMQVKPKKALGQHFLTDMNIAARIAATLDEYKGLPVIEVGPGTGVLTRFLLDAGHDVKVVEIDTESIQYLKENFPELEGRIIERDFLTLDLNEIVPGNGKFCVIGNYPYNISSQIFFHVLDYKDRVVCCSGMLQREVAERLAAPARTKARGILSVLLQAWYNVDYLFTVDEKVFNPPPKVKSGVIKMVRNDVDDLGCDPRLFKSVVKTSFGQRRKTLRNSLRGMLPPEVNPQVLEDPIWSQRPEQLSVEQFIQLTSLISSCR